MMTASRTFRRAFLRGMAQAIDLTGGIGRRRLARFRVGRQSVSRSVASNWSAIGRDLALAMRRYGEAHGR